jgi:hypothetical protein
MTCKPDKTLDEKTEVPITNGRQPDGRFAPGNNANPAGRSTGSRHKTTLAAEALLDGQAEGLVQKAVEMALAGDGVALRLCLERILPARKSRRVSVALPQIEKAEDLPIAMLAVTAAMADGVIAPDEAATIAGVIEIKRKTIETADIERRLAALEQRSEKNGK